MTLPSCPAMTVAENLFLGSELLADRGCKGVSSWCGPQPIGDRHGDPARGGRVRVQIPWNPPPIVELHEHVLQSRVVENPPPECPFDVILSIELRDDVTDTDFARIDRVP